MKQPRRLSLAQKKLLSKLGLNPAGWMFVSDDGKVLKFTDKGIERREELALDKNTGEVISGTMKKSLRVGARKAQ